MSIILGKYRHYSGKEYEVLYLAKCGDNKPNNERELEDMVVYRQLYDAPGFPKGTVWVRSLKEFDGEVEVNGRGVRRFERIEE